MAWLQIGDKVKVSNWLNTYVSTIIRVTKTKAVGETKTSDGRSFTTEFKREYDDPSWIRRYKRERFDQTRRELIK